MEQTWLDLEVACLGKEYINKDTKVDKAMDFNRRGRDKRAFNNDSEYEFYEDTHNEKGEYIGKSSGFGNIGDVNIPQPERDTMKSNENVALPMGNGNQRIIVYYPKTPEDVMVLIKHLKMNNPAVVNLDEIDAETAQRILDFLSGAVCALSGSAHRISGNMFLLSPKGVEITIPYEQK